MDGINDMPKKRFYRSRAHCNPLSHNDGFHYPNNPSMWDLNEHYPNNEGKIVKFLDIGMGFGGLTVALARNFPDKVVMGMEIRAKVCEYVRLRIEALRSEFPGMYQNASCLRYICEHLRFIGKILIRTNCMRYLPNYFNKGQLEKIFSVSLIHILK